MFLPLSTVFAEWGESIRNTWMNMDWNGFWGWFLIICGIIGLFLLVFFTEFKRPERDSVKFTAITIVVCGIFLGFGLHMVLISRGLW